MMPHGNTYEHQHKSCVMIGIEFPNGPCQFLLGGTNSDTTLTCHLLRQVEPASAGPCRVWSWAFIVVLVVAVASDSYSNGSRHTNKRNARSLSWKLCHTKTSQAMYSGMLQPIHGPNWWAFQISPSGPTGLSFCHRPRSVDINFGTLVGPHVAEMRDHMIDHAHYGKQNRWQHWAMRM